MKYGFAEKRFILKQLVKRNLTSKYKDSLLGIVWTILNPLFMTLLFTAIFSFLFVRKIPNFPIYYLSGYILFMFFSNGSTGAMQSIRSNAGILKQIYVPRHMFALGSVCTEVINLIIYFLLMIGLMYLTHAPFYWDVMIFALIPLVLLFMLTMGVGFLLAVMNTYYSDVGYLYSIFTMILMYASAIFFPMSIIPSSIRFFFELNPLYAAISCFRDVILYGHFPATLSLIYLAIWAIGLFLIGIYIFKLYARQLTLEL